METRKFAGGRRLVQCIATAMLGLMLCAGSVSAHTPSAQTDLSQLVVTSDAVGAGWTTFQSAADSTFNGLAPAAVGGWGAVYARRPMVALLLIAVYPDRATALASPGFSDPSFYWGHGNTTFEPLSGYGDGQSYRAYPPGLKADSGITFVDGNIVVFVKDDGFDTTDDADALANQIASAEDALLQSAGPPAIGSSAPPDAAGATQAPAPPAAMADPVGTVVTFYGLLNNGAYGDAWNLLGPHFVNGNSYDGWVRGYATTQSVQVSGVSAVAQSASNATVSLTIDSVDRNGSRLVRQRFVGTWDLVLIDGAWKLDTPHIRVAN